MVVYRLPKPMTGVRFPSLARASRRPAGKPNTRVRPVIRPGAPSDDGAIPLTRSRAMLKESDYVKIQVATPVANAAAMRKALGQASAGVQGKYKYCSGSWRAIGRFIPIYGAKPAIGETGKLEEVEEEVIQTICHKDKVAEVLTAIRSVHPYEEPTIDIMPRYEVE